jgi:sorbitol-specific phosphotransferase system component IIC
MLYRKSVLTALLVLIFLAFFGMLGLSARMFPQNYDWRYRVISNLLSPRDNPDHYWLPACGIVFAAVLMLPFAGYLHRNLQIVSAHVACVCAGALITGIIALICACLVVPQHVHDVLGVRRLHEFIARSAAGFLAIGMLMACWCAWKGFRKNLLQGRLFWTWSLVTLLPLVGVFVSESLLIFTRLKPAWSVPIRSALRHSVFWHLGFWEWLGSAAVFVFLCAAVFLTPSQAKLIVSTAQGAHDRKRGHTSAFN